MFMIEERRTISHANDTEQQAQQVAGNPRQQRFSTDIPLENANKNSLPADQRQLRSRENIA